MSLYWIAQACFLEQINHFATALAFSKRVFAFLFSFCEEVKEFSSKNEKHDL